MLQRRLVGFLHHALNTQANEALEYRVHTSTTIRLAVQPLWRISQAPSYPTAAKFSTYQQTHTKQEHNQTQTQQTD